MSEVLLVNPARKKRRTARRRRTTTRRRRTYRRRRNTGGMGDLLSLSVNPRRRRSYRRRNPALGKFLPFTPGEFIGATAGSVLVRMLTDLILKGRNRGPMGWIGNLGIAAGLGIAARKFMPKMAKPLALGAAGFIGARIAGETFLKRMGMAGVVDLGSDLGYVGGDSLGLGQTFLPETELGEVGDVGDVGQAYTPEDDLEGVSGDNIWDEYS